MRLRNILSVLCFLFVAVACSMEDDILNDLDTPTPEKADSYAVFDISLLTGENVSTKSSTSSYEEEGEAPTPSENTVNNCFIAVINEAGDVIANYYANNYPSGTSVSTGEIQSKRIQKHITVKVPEGEMPNLRFVAFAQIGDYTEDVSNLQKCISLKELEEVVLKTHPNTYVKTGSITVNELKENAKKKGEEWTLKLSSQNLVHTDDQCNVVTIPVKQRSARIQLDEFKVIGVGGEYDDVKVTGLQIQNTCRYTFMDSEYKGNDRFEKSYIYVPDGLIPGTGENEVKARYYGKYFDARFYVYENKESNQPTSLRISYTYNDGKEDGVCEFTIKSPNENGYADMVLANHVYKLSVEIKNATVNVGVKCATLDWQYNDDADHNLEFTYNN